MRTLRVGLLGLTWSLLMACGGVGTPASHAQEAASNIAENERFGRTDLVMQKVAPSLRAEFIKAHAAWGGRITIADLELANFRMEGTDDAEMDMHVTWYNAADQELRSTLLHQKWHGPKGDWLLVSETRTDGDLGLMGEKIVVQAPEDMPTHARFPTVRIGASD
jgi:hypothetical protein